MAETGSFTKEEAEVKAFIRRLKTGAAEPPWFDRAEPFVVARAPGRLDVLGGIADYSGSLVLQLPIREAALAAVQHKPTPGLRMVSLADDGGPARTLAIDGAALEQFLTGGFATARDWFRDRPDDHWGAYIAGVVVALARERGARPEPGRGLRVVLDSRVPEGAGVSSSAAIEVATITALAGLLEVPLAGADAALLCQKAENHVVGAACGIMDQMTSAVGRSGSLLSLLCQPAEVEGFIRPDPSIGFWGIDSGVRHSVAGTAYTSARVGAFMGYRILAGLRGMPTAGPNRDGLMWVDDPIWSGRLANVDPHEVELASSRSLPETMSGAAFLAEYDGVTDPATRVDPAQSYPVRRPTRHAVHEHQRALEFASLLQQTPSEEGFRRLGGLMFASHYGYTMCGLDSPATNHLVELIRTTALRSGLYGARITGGGGGGTVAVIGRADARPAVARIVRSYVERTGRPARILSGSSAGAMEFGVRRVKA